MRKRPDVFDVDPNEENINSDLKSSVKYRVISPIVPFILGTVFGIIVVVLALGH
jgi:hypothetical protein